MPSQYSSDVKAQALAMIATEGVSAEAAAASLGIPERTVSHWAQRWRQIAVEQDDKRLLDEDYRIALRYGELLHQAADYIGEDETGERAAKSLIGLNAVRGTSVDKILKRREAGTPDNLVSAIQEQAAQLRARFSVRQIATEITVETDG